MKKQIGVIILLLLLMISGMNANKSMQKFRKCFEEKCQGTFMDQKCCHIGTKVAKKGYSCSIRGVIATQKYLNTLRHKIHSKTTLPVDKLIHKVRQCRPYEDCLRCCCLQQKRRLLSTMRKPSYGG